MMESPTSQIRGELTCQNAKNVKDQPAEIQRFRAQRANRLISARHPVVLGRPSHVELRAGIGSQRSIDMPPVEVAASVSLSYAEGVKHRSNLRRAPELTVITKTYDLIL